ncbi:sigma-E processing peptidase SpoIIGA [Anaeroselena agilis]|uniref:Sporulation sigma-E factor-processing peptidase n=1 Tax=Anaeroselena agilis TaxID=3063788 RepID=A0ABU3NXY8_9FIRM|nr:sigma-E processing peptidase SpoIIGA [Selenomonadales bacterium 4137-cl]
MYVYADILLLINTIMNGLILLLTAWAAGAAFKPWRLIFAALLGALYALGGLFPGVAPLYSPAAKLAASAALVWLALGARSWRSLLFATACFYLVSLLLGGAILGWLMLAAPVAGGVAWPAVTWRHLAVGGLLALLLFGLVWRRLLAGLTRRRLSLPVILDYAGRRIRLTALLDTGNHLYTIGGQRPVVLVERAALDQLLGNAVSGYLQRTPPASWLADLDQCGDSQWLARVHIIPCRGIGGSGLLLGFRPDSLTVITATGSITADEVVVGIHSGRLATDGSYAALLHPAVMKAIDNKEVANICA